MSEKREFLNNLSRLPQAPSSVGNQGASSNSIQPYQGSTAITPLRLQDTPMRGSESVSATQQNMDSRKAAAYANVITRLNEARERSLPFKVSLGCCHMVLEGFVTIHFHIYFELSLWRIGYLNVALKKCLTY